ncbi:MAG: M15 family metallopeptidase [bacterium]|nr:M15 family metallopeptidase [bacterium]
MTSKNGGSAWHMSLPQQLTIAGFIFIIALVGIASWYGYLRLTTLSEQITQLDTKLDIQIASTTASLQNNLAEATSSLGNAFQQENLNVQAQLGGVRNQVGSITGVVTDLQKLSKTDPELLAKYSKVFFLSDTYAPARLVEIPSAYAYSETKQLQIIPEVLPYVLRMIEQAKAGGVALYVDSAYRSFASQKSLKGQYSVVYGTGTANQFSADQGYSEHQLGTTADFITTGTGGALAGFDATPAYAWMVANAYHYGFVLSYPKDNGYYIFEPWHWRFVGVKLATDLHTAGTYFYTMDQRAIDTYLISLFD